ncbi:hypothetical protein [Kitasatospora sp. NPDC091207]|uniref:hypothetical protein n=1 Tax=Kitasatospora sp. NPDC091207 TaxID=3364083 RepID=UPI0038041E7A
MAQVIVLAMYADEVMEPLTQRYLGPAPATHAFPPSPGYLWRTDVGGAVPAGFSTRPQDPRPAW